MPVPADGRGDGGPTGAAGSPGPWRGGATGGLAGALIDIRSASGFESPGPAFRRWAVGLWARSVAGRELHVAVLARHEHICPEKTGLLVAAEEGLRANIFEHEAQATAWLDEAAGDRRV